MALGVPYCCPLPNGHIFYFNNGYGRNFKLDFTDRKNVYTCGIEYEVDEVNRTVRQVWQYGKERGTAYFTPARSGCNIWNKRVTD